MHVLRHAAIRLCSQASPVRYTCRHALLSLQCCSGTLVSLCTQKPLKSSADHSVLSDWFSLSEREQRLLAEELGEMQRKLPYWAARRIFPGAAFDDLYATPFPHPIFVSISAGTGRLRQRLHRHCRLCNSRPPLVFGRATLKTARRCASACRTTTTGSGMLLFACLLARPMLLCKCNKFFAGFVRVLRQ